MPAIYHTKEVDDSFDGAVTHITESTNADDVVWHCQKAEEGFDGTVFHVKWADQNFDGPVQKVVGIARVIETIVSGVSPLSLPDAVADSLQYVKAYGKTEQRNLPDGYIERQFIYMLDGSYLLTDLVPTYDCKIEMDFATTSFPGSGSSFAGARSGGPGDGFSVGRNASNYVQFDGFDGNRYTSSTGQFATNTRYKYVWNNQVATLYQGTTTVDTKTFTGTGTTTHPLAINGLDTQGSVVGNVAGIYLYSFKMWNGQGELVANYVPAIQKGTVPVVGFYDTVSGTFKTATAGTFAAGGEAVPTPDTPMDIVCNNGVLKWDNVNQEIYTDGTVETLNIHGKNILDPLSIEQGSISGSTGEESSANNRCRTDYIKIKSGEIVCLTAKDDTPPVYSRVFVYDSNKGFVSNPSGTAVTSTGRSGYKYTATADGYVRFIFLQSANFTPSDIVEPQAEYTSTPTAYEAYYNGGTATAEMLLKVGDYQDVQEILAGDVTRNVGVKVLDGTEDWQNISGYYNISKTDIGSDSTVMPSGSIDIICTHYETISGVPDRTSVNIGGSYVNFRDDNISTLAAWQQYLADQYAAGTPVIVVYPLATETTESVAGQTLQVQAGDNTLEITQASMTGLELEAKYMKES